MSISRSALLFMFVLSFGLMSQASATNCQTTGPNNSLEYYNASGTLQFTCDDTTTANPLIPVPTKINLSHCQGLINLYCATDGDNWNNNTNWMTTDPGDTNWYGIGRTASAGTPGNPVPANHERVTYFYLSDNNLVGNIPNIFNTFTVGNNGLVGVDFSQNKLTGTIPNSLDSHPTLQSIQLHENALTGNISAHLNNFINNQVTAWNGTTIIKPLTVHFNKFDTTIPAVSNTYTAIDQDWEKTQTVAPSGLVTTSTNTGIDLTWNAIDFNGALPSLSPTTSNFPSLNPSVSYAAGTQIPGGYEIWRQDNGSGNYNLISTTNNLRQDTNYTDTLSVGGMYCYKIKTITPSHNLGGTNQPNNLESDFSAPQCNRFTPPPFCANFDIPQIECEALIDLYNSAGGANWTAPNMTSSYVNEPAPVIPGGMRTACDWPFVTCHGPAPTQVKKIDINSGNLNGTLPVSFNTAFNALQAFYISNEPNLTGNLPTLASMNAATNNSNQDLIWLAFDNTSISDDIPLEWCDLTQLITLKITTDASVVSGRPYGNLPSCFNNFTQMDMLWIQGTDMTGAIPDYPNMGSALTSPSFALMFLSNNRFTTLPSVLPPNIANGGFGYFFSNEMSGLIPNYPSTFTNFSIGCNKFTGANTLQSITIDDHFNSFEIISNDPNQLVSPNFGNTPYMSIAPSGSGQFSLTWNVDFKTASLNNVFNPNGGYIVEHSLSGTSGPWNITNTLGGNTRTASLTNTTENYGVVPAPAAGTTIFLRMYAETDPLYTVPSISTSGCRQKNTVQSSPVNVTGTLLLAMQGQKSVSLINLGDYYPELVKEIYDNPKLQKQLDELVTMVQDQETMIQILETKGLIHELLGNPDMINDYLTTETPEPKTESRNRRERR